MAFIKNIGQAIAGHLRDVGHQGLKRILHIVCFINLIIFHSLLSIFF